MTRECAERLIFTVSCRETLAARAARKRVLSKVHLVRRGSLYVPTAPYTRRCKGLVDLYIDQSLPEQQHLYRSFDKTSNTKALRNVLCCTFLEGLIIAQTDIE